MKQVLFITTLISFLLVTQNVPAQVTIQSAEDVTRWVQAQNFDIKTMTENTRAAKAALDTLKGSLYNPTLSSTASYEDSNEQPLSPFEPASYQSFFWQTYLESKTPYGMTMTLGHDLARYHFGQSDPPNALLPYPITYYQPQTYVQMSLDLAQDFLGYLTTKQIKMAELDVSAAKFQEKLLKHKMTALALDLYYQIPVLKNIRALSYKMISDFKELEASLSSKVDRSLAEKSDLLSVQATTASQLALLRDVDRAVEGLQTSLAALLGATHIEIRPNATTRSVVNNAKSCETEILNTPFDTSLTQEFAMLSDQKQKANLQGKTYKRTNIPSVTLTGEATTTGSATEFNNSYDEQNTGDWPIYSVGLNLTWQPSLKKTKANRELAKASENTADYQWRRRLMEQEQLWENTQTNITLLRTKYAQSFEAVNLAKQQVDELERNYNLGRTSLFELTQQKINLLKLQIEAQTATQERVSNVLQSLQYFDQVSCELIR